MDRTYHLIYEHQYSQQRLLFSSDARLYGQATAVQNLLTALGHRSAHLQNLLEIGHTTVLTIRIEIAAIQALLKCVNG
jgi:hypothetical protein